MAAYRFRTALGGFHKGDVAGYIEKTAAKHRSDILEYEKVIADLQEQNKALQQQVSLLMETCYVPEEPENQPMPAPDPQPVAEASEFNKLELDAYRRAEAAERNANARAKKLYQQLDQMREDAMAEFEITDNVVKETLEAIRSQAAVVERAYGVLADTLDTSRETLGNMVVVQE